MWFYSAMTLTELGSKLQSELKVTPWEYDLENLYEWAESRSLEGTLEFNLSRKHQDGLPWPTEPYHLSFSFHPLHLNAMAQSISSLIHNPVYVGTIVYLGGDDYEYHPLESFQPNGGQT